MGQEMHRLLIAAVVVVAALASGCVSTQPVGPQNYVNEGGVGYDEVVAMIAASKPQSEIIAQIRARGMRHAPSSADMETLRTGGASQEVMDAVIAVTWQPSSRVAEAPPGVGYAPGYYSAWPGYYDTWPGYYYGPAIGFGYYGYRGRPWVHRPYPHWHGPSRIAPPVRPPSAPPVVRPPSVAPPSVTPFRGVRPGVPAPPRMPSPGTPFRGIR
ncbi:MAG TPA: hypothetical protein PKA20_30435 [Burkholderiaceae bacterium]|nr:hypothetical protein [Burkholderiaceae bacterium]